MAYKILMVDDNVKNLGATKGFLEANGLEVETTQSAKDALERVAEDEFALVLLDYQMPEMNGDILAAKIREINPLQQFAMFSCDQTRSALKNSYKAGAVEFIEKNEPPEIILATVLSYCHRYETVCRTIRPTKDKSFNAELLRSLEMVGRTEIMGKAAQKIIKLGEASDISVFISGETGTGKELAARALHDRSNRAGKPFVAINCAAIPRDLLESELFGHVRGAFTGAVDKKDGKFVLANGGTIFLDEIADMPLELQAKLLRVVQERTVEPVGGRFSFKVDVRIITASHKDLDECVKAGKFREDLKYRILVADVCLPPLRDRVDDIELLVGHFTKIYNKQYNINRYFQRRTLDILKKYSWPGNVRELMNVVEKHMIQADGPAIRPEDLSVNLYQSMQEISGTITLSVFEDQQSIERQNFILQTIEATGSKAEAARRLGVSPAHLQYLLGQSKAAKTKENQKKHAAANLQLAHVERT
jgi:DNA-binding NtrC family response regulator